MKIVIYCLNFAQVYNVCETFELEQEMRNKNSNLIKKNRMELFRCFLNIFFTSFVSNFGAKSRNSIDLKVFD